MNRRRLLALERLLGNEESEPTVMAVVADCQCLDRWLDSIGMTAREVLAAGLTEPPEMRLRWTSIADEVEAEESAEAYLRERGLAADDSPKS